MLSDYFAIYAGTDKDNMTLICSSDTSYGVLNPQLTKEINTAGSLTFVVLPNHSYADSFKRYTTIVDVYIRGDIVFRGRVTTISSDMFKQKTITCEGNYNGPHVKTSNEDLKVNA